MKKLIAKVKPIFDTANFLVKMIYKLTIQVLNCRVCCFLLPMNHVFHKKSLISQLYNRTTSHRL